MNYGSLDRVPASSLILFASIVFTFTSYLTFRVLWEVPIPAYLFIAVLGLQFASMLLGSSKILTPLGAASLSAVIAVVACIAAIVLIFPEFQELKIAGAAGAVSALIFILSSFVAASREDPVPSRGVEPLVLGELKDNNKAELIKYGEVEAPDSSDIHDIPLSGTVWEEGVSEERSVNSSDQFSPFEDEDIYEFDGLIERNLAEDELAESWLGISPGADGLDSQPEAWDANGKTLTSHEGQDIFAGSTPEPNETTETAILGDWVKETADLLTNETSEDMAAAKARIKEGLDESSPALESAPGLGMRTRFKVLDASSGVHYGTYYGDEGYSTLDMVSLNELLSSDLAVGELKIVKLDWSNFDEVEVHIRVEEALPVDLEVDDEDDAGVPELLCEQRDGEIESLPEEKLSEELQVEEALSAVNGSGPRYMIYDRRTIQPMGEYIPETERSRIDRLTLYKMFPDYDFKTFEIDSIRWEDDEVRILIRGEKKQSPKSKVQRKI